MRSYFATALLRHGKPATEVMMVCCWKDLETMVHYIWLSGIDTSDTTNALKILPESEIAGKVVRVSDYKK